MAGKLELQLTEFPALRAPVLLAAFAGWGDGALAGTSALQYLLGKQGARSLGAFDSDELYDYASSRPVTVLRDDGTRELIWPSLELYACPLPDAARDALLLIGPEPNLRWRACAAGIVDAAVQLGVSAVTVLGSYWDRVTHLGQPLLTGRAADSVTRGALIALDVPESRYQGPTGFTSALLDACAGRGVPAAGLSGRAPHYAQGSTHPKLAWGLLDTVGRLTGLRFDLAELEQAGRKQERLLTEQAQQEAKLWRYILRLAAEQGQGAALDQLTGGPWRTIAAAPSAESTPPASAGRPDLPSPQEAVDAVEEFFRRAGRGS